MDIKSKAYQTLLARRPLNVRAKFGNSEMGLVSGRDIAAAMKKLGTICLATNARNPLVIKAALTAAKKHNTAIIVELAKSESTYCGATYDNIPDYALKYSEEMGNGAVFALHVDHYAIKGEADLLKGASHLTHILNNGFTSVAIDASHLADFENFKATREIAGWISPEIGLEVEVGEIKGPGELSTVEEALYYVGGLNAWNIFPDYLAISNGSKHGTYDTTAGQAEGIDLRRTKEIADAIAPYGVAIAQHGISGTPIDKCATFLNYGIRKGNVATLFQNLCFGLEVDEVTGNAITTGGTYHKDPNRGISKELWDKMVAEADSKGYPRNGGDYKKFNLTYCDAILSEPKEIQDRIVDEMVWWIERYIKAFKSEGSAEMVAEVMAKREDENAAPERKILGERREFLKEFAPNKGGSDGGDYDD